MNVRLSCVRLSVACLARSRLFLLLDLFLFFALEAPDYVADRHLLLGSAFPIGFVLAVLFFLQGLPDAQRHPPLLGAKLDDLDLDVVADLDYLVGLADAARRQLVVRDDAFDSAVELHERSERNQARDTAVDGLPLVVPVARLRP